MEKSSKRGKIPQSDWPLIMARYDAGETLASIARTYDCSPPAISYVVSRSRARPNGAAAAPPAASATEPQLVKAPAVEPASGIAKPQSVTAPVAAEHGETPASATVTPASGWMPRDEPPVRPEAVGSAAAEQRAETSAREMPREFNGLGAANPAMAGRAAAAPDRPVGMQMAPSAVVAPGNGDARRTLHLSLGGAPPNGPHASGPAGNGATPAAEPPAAERHDLAQNGRPPQPPASQPQFARPEGATAAAAPQHYGAARSGNGDGPQRKDGAGAFIDKELRARVDGDIAAFLAAFDSALAQDTQESRSSLREATDRLLRAGARTRIELERLEARVPLPPRDSDRRGEPAWRQR
jgi:hypothetical protein